MKNSPQNSELFSPSVRKICSGRCRENLNWNLRMIYRFYYCLAYVIVLLQIALGASSIVNTRITKEKFIFRLSKRTILIAI